MTPGDFRRSALECRRTALRARRDDGRGAERRRVSRSMPGQSVALIAPSGAGKSTLLHLAGLLERPSARRGRLSAAPDVDHDRRAAHGAAAQPDRLRLPVPSSAAGILGAGEPRPAADDRRAFARRGRDAARASSSAIWASPRAKATARPSFRAASSSASPSPARSPTARASCWPTSRPAISTPRPRAMSSRPSPRSSKRPASPPSSPPTTSSSPRAWTAG